jgi:hyperosmotically inducible protein
MKFQFLAGTVVLCLAMCGIASASVAALSQSDQIRHQILMSPYYGVFDWVEGSVLPNKTVVLKGEVRNPYAKSDVASRIRKIEGIKNVVNEIEVLPVSPSDDHLRLAIYRAIFRYNGPLFRYASPVVPSIHIIVNNGRATLKGVVGNTMDRQLAYFAARNVPGLFEVANELSIDKS